MTAPRWAGQDSYDTAIRAAVVRYGGPGLTVPLVKAIIATESGFNPMAYREEAPRSSLPPTADFPQGGDASFGLMQLLSRTARGLGYRGTLDGLFNPAINIDLGTRLLSDNLRRAGSVPDSVSAYNGGFRPTLGYGSPLAGGSYANQSYVTAVLRNLDYFREWEAGKGGTGVTPDSFPDDDTPARGGGTDFVVRHQTNPPMMRWPKAAIIGGIAVWVILSTCYYLVA